MLKAIRSFFYNVKVFRQVRRIEKVTRQKIDGCSCFWCKQ